MMANHQSPALAGPAEGEHAVLCRHMGGLQKNLSTLLVRQHEAIRRLEAETVRLRGQLVLTRTAILWGLHAATVQAAPGLRADGSPLRTTASARSAPPAQTREVLCQVGCRGHAHPWRDALGQCGLDGQACTPAPD
jgi:hypothetical protein